MNPRPLIAAIVLSVASAVRADSVRLFGCDEPVQSHKRGLCENKLSADEFRAIAPGVSWYYNWHYKTDDVPPAGVQMEFVPMMWGDSDDRYAGLADYLSKHRATAVLALNEPNLKGQAFISPEQAAKAFLKTKAIADQFNLPTVGPQLALGSATNESISADDPIEKKRITYTFMVPFMKAFNYYLGDTKVAATAFHSYGNVGEMAWAVGLMQKEFDRPVWVTEFAQWHAESDKAELAYVVEATDLLERTKNVQAYAWFKERVKDNPRISIFEANGSKLTPVGEAYVKMPVHDPDVFYKLPGRLSAGRYADMKEMKIAPSKDQGAFVEMTADHDGGWCDYNLHSDVTGTCSLSIRAKGDGEITLQSGSHAIATARSAGNVWQTVNVQLPVTRGEQTVRVVCGQKGLTIASLEFGK